MSSEFHHWLSNDNGIECFRCGVALDFWWLPEDDYLSDPENEVLTPTQQQEAERKLMMNLPSCPGPSDKRAHHFAGAIYVIECVHGDCSIGEETELDSIDIYCRSDQ